MISSPRNSTCAAILCAASLAVSTASAITLGQVDTFSGGDGQWLPISVESVPDSGPLGEGDFSLRATAGGGSGSGSRLVIYNVNQWAGNWTTAGVERIAVNLRNPNTVPLTMRLAFAGPGQIVQGGGDNSYSSTTSFTLPADGQWRQAIFDVQPGAWAVLFGQSAAASLTAVQQFRILHNPSPSFLGAQIAADFDVDNIRATIVGDYNGDARVDAADYTVWRDTLGAAGGALPGDGDANGAVAADDRIVWINSFGDIAASAPAATAIPEPEAALIAVLAAGLLLVRPLSALLWL